jgi:ATP-dependent DNA helicase RecQ
MRQQAEQWMKNVLGAKAAFRDGQWEAIEALVQRQQRVLVVQRTGWGKSSVYFLATRLLRQQQRGATILISPLLSLMRNQIDSARQWGLKAASIDSTNPNEHNAIESQLLNNQLDLLLISPERLANERFQDKVWSRLKGKVGLLVIDEAHCISDWGHDFRPNYRRIMSILSDLPAATPVLATTATANDRVVEDVSEIVGTGMNILRGALTRESLRLYVYRDPMDTATRLTLLSHLMNSLRGSGIIYCTTTRDCQQVADWLQQEGHNVQPYYAQVEEDYNVTREQLEQGLLNNKVKALAASVALGMGFDKPDLHFVIHFQKPGNIINYYQQIGRAGRGIEQAFIILMHGQGDDDIQQYFIETAFPSPAQVKQVIAALEIHVPMKKSDFQKVINVRYSALEKILTHLEVEGILERDERVYRLAANYAEPDYARWQGVTKRRQEELVQMQAYIDHEDCLMRFIAEALDDPTNVQPCGRCKNCRGDKSKFQPDIDAIERAHYFLRGTQAIPLPPRKVFPAGLPGIKKTTELLPHAQGVALCHYYESGLSAWVKQDRTAGKAYRDELLERSVALLQTALAEAEWSPQWVTAVPSLRRPTLVPEFAQRLAQALNLPYIEAIRHTKQHPPQETMHNSYNQALNVHGVFTIAPGIPRQAVLLVDDLADSRWTLTMIAHQLQLSRVPSVLPFVLATTGTN